MSLFTISDLHLSLSSNKSMDIFPGWDGYVEKIKKRWTSVVSNDDTVVIIGDISWAMKIEESFSDMNFINSLPGKKILIKGNHDLWWSTKKKVQEYFDNNNLSTLKVLFNDAIPVDDVCVCGTRGWFYDEQDSTKKILNREVGRLETSIRQALKTNLKPIVFLHYPPVYYGQECVEILDVLKYFSIKKCYYGHVHGPNASKKVITGPYCGINFEFVSCDYTNFSPVLVK